MKSNDTRNEYNAQHQHTVPGLRFPVIVSNTGFAGSARWSRACVSSFLALPSCLSTEGGYFCDVCQEQRSGRLGHYYYIAGASSVGTYCQKLGCY